MFTSITLRANERALELRDGRPCRLLGAGRHTLFTPFGGAELVRYDLDAHFTSATQELLAVLAPREGVEHLVGDDELGLLRVDGVPRGVLAPGRWVLWTARAEVSCDNVSVAPLEASTVPPAFQALAGAEVERVVVPPATRGVVVVDGRVERVLEPGAYGFFTRDRALRVELVDLREQLTQVVAQEVMTADKVTLRLTVIVKFRVSDPLRATQSVTSLRDAIYSEAQIHARRHVALRTVDELLEQRNDTSEALHRDLGARLAEWGIALARVDLKDLALPGDMRALLNQVIEAEKRAAANGILRREETASTRSLANTAKLLESNPTLLRLKELEAWKEIAGTVGNVTVVAAPQQLLGALSLGGPRVGAP